MNGCECELDDGNASMRRKGYDEYNVGMLKYGDEWYEGRWVWTNEVVIE